MKSPLISVIIPTYNVARIKNIYCNTINSVLSQSYQNFELIIINDGSTDNTAHLLEELKAKDNRIKVFHKKNCGVESARRMGLEKSIGDFILHLDQDDLYEKDAFKIFIEKAIETEADVVIANSSRFIFSSIFKFKPFIPSSMRIEKSVDHDSFIKEYYRSFFGINDLPVNIWNKLYRKSFLESVPNPPLTGQIIEDLSYNMHILPYAKKIHIIPNCLYYYRWGGFTNRYDKTILDTALIGYQLKMNLIEKDHYDNFRVTTSIELLNYINTYFYDLLAYKQTSKEEFIAEVDSVINLPEVQSAKKVVCEYDKYHKAHIDAIIEGDLKALYFITLNSIKKNKIKFLLKKLLLFISRHN